MTNDPLTPAQQYERDVRLYGVTVARWLKAQKILGITQNTPGLGSNGKGRQERDGYKPGCGIPVSQNGLDVCREDRSIAESAFGNAASGGYAGVARSDSQFGVAPVACIKSQTGYEPAVDSRQVPSPTISTDKPFNLKSLESYL